MKIETVQIFLHVGASFDRYFYFIYNLKVKKKYLVWRKIVG
jgi:hypothetical protein